MGLQVWLSLSPYCILSFQWSQNEGKLFNAVSLKVKLKAVDVTVDCPQILIYCLKYISCLDVIIQNTLTPPIKTHILVLILVAHYCIFHNIATS